MNISLWIFQSFIYRAWLSYQYHNQNIALTIVVVSRKIVIKKNKSAGRMTQNKKTYKLVFLTITIVLLITFLHLHLKHEMISH
jgi:uncharacterized membrane protein (DUF373 family)